MTKWQGYPHLDRIHGLKNEGRELLGKTVFLQEKRDGENVSISFESVLEPHHTEGPLGEKPNIGENDDVYSDGLVRISSHHMEHASPDIEQRMEATSEYKRILALLLSEQTFGNGQLIAYGELLNTISPTRVEPQRKHIHWVMFDIFNAETNTWYTAKEVYKLAYHFNIPMVKLVHAFMPATVTEILDMRDNAIKWCRRHRREGVVGKAYIDGQLIAFKEKVDVMKLPALHRKVSVSYPAMPADTIQRGLQHAFDDAGLDGWKNKSIAMPLVAKHLQLEASEHNYAVPHNMFELYSQWKLPNTGFGCPVED